MDRHQLVDYCLAKAGAEETYPWGEQELVAKVGGKGFAFIGPGSFSVKCGRDAAEAAEWRDRYPAAITVSHYTGRYGWNSVDLAGGIPDDELRLRAMCVQGAFPILKCALGAHRSTGDRSARASAVRPTGSWQGSHRP